MQERPQILQRVGGWSGDQEELILSFQHMTEELVAAYSLVTGGGMLSPA